MEEGLARLYTGNFNSLDMTGLGDNITLVELKKQGENKVFRFRVRDLYGENEEVLEHEVVTLKPVKYLTDRLKEAEKQMKEAQKHANTGNP